MSGYDDLLLEDQRRRGVSLADLPPMAPGVPLEPDAPPDEPPPQDTEEPAATPPPSPSELPPQPTDSALSALASPSRPEPAAPDMAPPAPPPMPGDEGTPITPKPQPSAIDSSDESVKILRELAGPHEPPQGLQDSDIAHAQGNDAMMKAYNRFIESVQGAAGARPAQYSGAGGDEAAGLMNRRALLDKEQGQRNAAARALAEGLGKKSAESPGLEAFRLAEAEKWRNDQANANARADQLRRDADEKAKTRAAAGQTDADEVAALVNALGAPDGIKTRAGLKAWEDAQRLKGKTKPPSAPPAPIAVAGEDFDMTGVVGHSNQVEAKKILAGGAGAMAGLKNIDQGIKDFIAHPSIESKKALTSLTNIVAGGISEATGSGTLNGGDLDRIKSALGTNSLDPTSLMSLFDRAADPGNPDAAKAMLTGVHAAMTIVHDQMAAKAGVYGAKPKTKEKSPDAPSGIKLKPDEVEVQEAGDPVPFILKKAAFEALRHKKTATGEQMFVEVLR